VIMKFWRILFSVWWVTDFAHLCKEGRNHDSEHHEQHWEVVKVKADKEAPEEFIHCVLEDVAALALREEDLQGAWLSVLVQTLWQVLLGGLLACGVLDPEHFLRELALRQLLERLVLHWRVHEHVEFGDDDEGDEIAHQVQGALSAQQDQRVRYFD